MDAARQHSSTSADVILRFMEKHYAMTIAVADAEGIPWAAPVFYVNEGFRVYWLTVPSNRLGTCLSANPRASVAILGGDQDWRLMQGLQIEGSVRQISSWSNYLRCARRFLRKFPGFATGLLSSPKGGPLARKAPRMRFYLLEGERCWFTDHSRGIGNRIELDLRRINVPNGEAAVEQGKC